MPEPKTLPHGGDPSLQERPSDAQYAWLGRAERLLSAFERTLPAPAAGQASLSLGFILMAADYLWDQHGDAADFAKLEVRGFAQRCHALLSREGIAAAFCQTLLAFYAHLVEVGEVDAGVAQAIAAQLLALQDERPRG